MKTKGLGQFLGGWAEPTRAQHIKEFGASALFLSSSISCGIHETLPQLTEFSSSSTDGTCFPSRSSDGLIIWITWEWVQSAANPTQSGYWGVPPVPQGISMLISHHQQHTKPLNTDQVPSQEQNCQTLPTQSPVTAISTNFHPYLFKSSLHTVTAIDLRGESA